MYRVVLVISLCIAFPTLAVEPVLLWNTAGDRASFDQMRQALEEAGGHAQHAYIPYFLAGRITPEHLLDLPPSVAVLTLEGDRSLLTTAPEDAQRFAEAWTMAMLKQRQPREIPENLPPLINDVIEIPVPVGGSMGRDGDRDIPYGADETDTSQYMIGDVSVGVIFPESDETSSNTEDWTDEEIANVKAEILGGLDWWAARESAAGLTFVYHYEERIPVQVEPIEESSGYRHVWMNDVLLYLGYGPEQYPVTPLVFEFVNDLRIANETEWGFAIFVVDSSADDDGKFDDGKFAFTVFHEDGSGGGPYQVMTLDNGPYGISNMDVVCAHETGHIFGALDEYGSCSCGGQSGYLYYENQNCENDCLLDELSIMGNGNIITAFTNGAVDLYARGQVGWQDTDGDGILDIEDTHPLLSMPSVPDQTEYSFQLTGSAVVNPLEAPNPYYNTSSINTLTGVEYRLNGGDWLPGTADDGTFDGPEENFTLDITVTENGTYTLECRAENNVGNYTNPVVTDEFEVDTATDTPDIPLAFRLDAAVPNPFNPSTTIRFSLPVDTEVSLVVYDLSGHRVTELITKDMPQGNHEVEWRGRDDQGEAVASGVYFYRLDTEGFTETRKMTLLK